MYLSHLPQRQLRSALFLVSLGGGCSAQGEAATLNVGPLQDTNHVEHIPLRQIPCTALIDLAGTERPRDDPRAKRQHG